MLTRQSGRIKPWSFTLLGMFLTMAFAPLWVGSTAAQESSVARADALNEQVDQLYRVGRYGDAIPIAKKALSLRENALGPEHPDIAISLNNLAVLYQNQELYAEAETLHKRSVAIKEKALGPEHPDVAVSLNNLARVYEEEGRYAEAEPLYQRSLVIRENALGLERCREPQQPGSVIPRPGPLRRR